MSTSQKTDADINLKKKEEYQNSRIRIDLKKHNWLLRKIKKEKLKKNRSKRSEKRSKRSSVKTAPKQRQTLPVSLPIALFHKYLARQDNMNNQPSLRGIKLVQQQPISVHAKPLQRTASTSKDLADIELPPIEKNRVEPVTPPPSPVPQTISIIQHTSQSSNLTLEDQARTQIDLLRQVRRDIQNLTNETSTAIESSSNAVLIIETEEYAEPQENEKISQTDYEIFLSHEDTEIMNILKQNSLNKDNLLNLIQTASNENNNQLALSNNNVETINLVEEDSNEQDQLDTKHEILDSIRVHSDINKSFINLMLQIQEIKRKADALPEKSRTDVYYTLITIFYRFFNEEAKYVQKRTADKATQTTKATQTSKAKTLNRNIPNKRRYLSIMPNMDNTQSNNNMINTVSQKGLRPPLPPQLPEQQRQGQKWLEQFNSMNRQINNKVYKQKCDQNSPANQYSPITPVQYTTQQIGLSQSQLPGGYGRNDLRMYHAEAMQAYSRQPQPGCYSTQLNQEPSNSYGQYGYQYQQPNMVHPQPWGNQQN